MFTVLFQNCGQFIATSSSNLPLNHPSVSNKQSGASTDRLLLGDAFYVMSVFKDVFTDVNSSAEVVTFVEQVLRDEILSAQTEFGRACSLFNDGALQNCNNNASYQAIAMKSFSSSLREAARLQTCQSLVNNDSVLNGLISRVKGQSENPSKESISLIVQLFFPALESLPTYLEPLLDMNSSMNSRAEATISRWRLIILTVCEEPGWQLL